MKKALLVALCLGLSACSTTNLAEVVKAMNGSTGSTCVKLNTVYGTASVAHTNVQNGTASCTGEGLTVKEGNLSGN